MGSSRADSRDAAIATLASRMLFLCFVPHAVHAEVDSRQRPRAAAHACGDSGGAREVDRWPCSRGRACRGRRSCRDDGACVKSDIRRCWCRRAGGARQRGGCARRACPRTGRRGSTGACCCRRGRTRACCSGRGIRCNRACGTGRAGGSYAGPRARARARGRTCPCPGAGRTGCSKADTAACRCACRCTPARGPATAATASRPCTPAAAAASRLRTTTAPGWARTATATAAISRRHAAAATTAAGVCAAAAAARINLSARSARRVAPVSPGGRLLGLSALPAACSFGVAHFRSCSAYRIPALRTPACLRAHTSTSDASCCICLFCVSLRHPSRPQGGWFGCLLSKRSRRQCPPLLYVGATLLLVAVPVSLARDTATARHTEAAYMVAARLIVFASWFFRDAKYEREGPPRDRLHFYPNLPKPERIPCPLPCVRMFFVLVV